MGVEMTMKQLRPFWGRISLLESPVDEAERHSGLVVPLAYDGDDGIKRGVIVDLDRITVDGDGAASPWWDALDTGTVVYYRGGVRIGDVVLIEIHDILAIESS